MLDNYYINKRLEILKKIKPVCEAYGITNYDYIVEEQHGYARETLVVEGTKIKCGGNSVYAVENELLAYIFVTRYCRARSLGAFEKQTLNVIKRYWIKEGK